MAETGRLSAVPTMRIAGSPVLWLRVLIIVVVLAIWEAVAASGLLYRDVVPSLVAIARATVNLLSNPEYYWNLGVTAGEVGTSLIIGGLSGLVVGLVLGGSRLLTKAYEPYLYYLGPTPKIIFFPIMIMWFGVGTGSKIAMGAISCFFPIALSAAAGMRQIEPNSDPRRAQLPCQCVANGNEDLFAGHAPSDYQRRAAGSWCRDHRDLVGGDQALE